MSRPQAELPEGRYGRKKRPGARRRWPLWVFAGCALVAGVIGTYLVYLNIGAKPITAQRIGFADRPGNAMEITIDVRRDDPSRQVVCIVRVRDITGAETGRKELLVPPGDSTTRAETVIRSSAEPVTADVFGCSYSVPEYLSRTVRPTE